MIRTERSSADEILVPTVESNLLLTDRTDVSGEIERAVRLEIARAFAESRAFTALPDVRLLDLLRAGIPAADLQPDLHRLQDRIIEQVAAGDQTEEQRLKDDGRLSARLINALTCLHQAIASTERPQLQTRRFVLMRESPGTLGLQAATLEILSNDQAEGKKPQTAFEPIIARVGKGPQWVEAPTIYLPLRVFDVILTDRQHGRSLLFAALVQLLLVEERAIETGYAHTEELSADEIASLSGLATAIVEAAPAPAIAREVAAPKPAPVKPFTERNQLQILALLDSRDPSDGSLFDFASNMKAIDEIEKHARRYRKSGDRASLREIVRLAVAASGHDLHEVRNRANLILERLFSAKDFDAPLATNFAGIVTGERYAFSFPLTEGKHSHILRIFRGKPVDGLITDRDIEFADVEMTLDASRGVFVAEHQFTEIGSYDYLVYRRSGKSLQWINQRRCSGRINVMPDLAGEIVLEIFPDIHGHSRMYWRDGSGHPGLVYNENGEIIRLGRFSDVTAHLEDLKERYRITMIYMLGVQQRGKNREDWAPEATSPSPFAPMSLTMLEPSLGGETEFRELVERAHALDVRVIVDTIPHLNRHATEVPDDWRVRCYDENGQLVVRASTDGKFGSWNDGALMNYRKFEVWEWLTNSVVKLIKEFGIDGIRFDSAHSVPIMMKRNNFPFLYDKSRNVSDIVEGTIIVNDRENDQFITTGYYDSACREVIANPFQTYLVGAIHQAVRETGKSFFVYLAECYWGRERYLAKSGIVPYNSALFKICEQIIHGTTDVREIYHLYDSYYPQALPPGTELLGILGNHDERRALNTFGQRGLNAAVGLTSFMSHMIMDYEGSAEGEGWKVFLDNIYVNWNQFEYASHRSVERFYDQIYDFHRRSRGRGYLVWANNNLVAAALKFYGNGMTLGLFNFSNENQACSVQFDSTMLPIPDDGFYRVVDPLYSSVTNHYNYFTGRELRVSRLHTTVSYTDRVKLLSLEAVENPPQLYDEFMRDSFFRMCTVSEPDDFPSYFAFREIASHIGTFEEFAQFAEQTLIALFDEQNERFLELGLKRALFHIGRIGLKSGNELLKYIDRLRTSGNKRIAGLGASLHLHNERGPIIFVSAEADPFSKYGGLANVVYELPRELVALGESVYVITPLYRFGDDKATQKMQKAIRKYNVTYTGVNVRFMIQGTEYEVGVHYGVVDGVKYYLLDHHEFFDGLYWGYTSVEKLRRRIAFARACAEVMSRFDLHPSYTFTNDAYAGVFNAIVKLDPHYSGSLTFTRNSFIHLIHNGGWQYFDSYHRYENGFDLFELFNLPMWKVDDFSDPVHGEKLNCMSAGIRCADRVITVSPSYARQLTVASDGLEHLLTEVTGINNAIGRDFLSQMQRRFDDSGIVDTCYPRLIELLADDKPLKARIESRYAEILDGARACEKINDPRRRDMVTRVRNKLLMQIQEGLTVDPDRLVFSMIHRIVDQKGFQLLLDASEGVFRHLGYQGVIAGPVSHGDQKAEEIARGLSALGSYYPGTAAVHIGFHDVSISLLSSDVFLMPSQYEPGGISQLEAFACGCLVVARATGGLRDTVFPIHKASRSITGNGFLFTDYSPSAFFDAMERCARFFSDSSDELVEDVRNFAKMSVGYWDRSASRYIEEIYAMKEVIRGIVSPGEKRARSAADHR